MATTTRSSSGLSYPERFFSAASYVGLGQSSSNSNSSSSKSPISNFKNDTALLLYGLYQQATVGPCNVPKPRIWSPTEQSKWTSWNGLGNMASAEAMRLFVKILEEEEPTWYSKVPEFVIEPLVDVEINNTKMESVAPNGNHFPEPKTISTENGILAEAQDKDVVTEGIGSIAVYDQWIALTVSGQLPKARYEHAAAVVQDSMHVFGGNHNGRYLNDLQVLDFRSLTWSKVEVSAKPDSSEVSPVPLPPCAGHSLIPWENKLISIAGHTKDPTETITVKAFDLQSSTWSTLRTYGEPPISRGGQSVTLVGTTLVIFGGEDASRSLLNDLHILDLETMTWDDIDTVGMPPSPRSDHAAAVHAERYLLIFGGGSHATCFNDLHVLDLETMEWSRPKQQGSIPTPRAGLAGVTVGENWFIVGGGDNKSGASETVVLNMSTLVWSVVTTVQGRVPIASEGLSLVVSSYNSEDILVAFGGYNGRYNNEVNILKPSNKSTLQSNIMERSMPDSVDVHHATNATRDGESEFESGKIREIVMDNVDSDPMGSGRHNIKSGEHSERIIAALKTEKDEIEAAFTKEQLQTLKLKQELAEQYGRNTDISEASILNLELQSVRAQLASEQSRCFKLEVDIAELRQKLQTMETLQKELELLQRQKLASEQAAANAKKQQSSGGVWGWIAGNPTPRNRKSEDDYDDEDEDA
ncbi:hypothetical protein C5167_020923 [Papaver somniferum]|uniref:ACB domain-containing protein n=1 Tax=Papaver somniferum TaxID=3469 RepID=A0A4Y7IYD3_PAPSO|nr:hypothetical protein C5167_020923 [Papaver somniferum]